MQKIFLIFIALVSISSCNRKLKETVGIVTPGPDEYKVQRSKALEIPPHYDLPSPYQTKDHKDIHNDKSSKAN